MDKVKNTEKTNINDGLNSQAEQENICQGKYGFAPLAIQRIQEAQTLNKVSIFLVSFAILAFVVFGTLASLQMFHNNLLMYQLFHYFPYAFVYLSMPLTVYNAFILYRYRLSQPSMIALCLVISSALLCISFFYNKIAWLAMVAWIAMAFLFKANFKRFFNFLQSRE